MLVAGKFACDVHVMPHTTHEWLIHDACLEEIATCRIHAGKFEVHAGRRAGKHLQEICRNQLSF